MVSHNPIKFLRSQGDWMQYADRYTFDDLQRACATNSSNREWCQKNVFPYLIKRHFGIDVTGDASAFTYIAVEYFRRNHITLPGFDNDIVTITEIYEGLRSGERHSVIKALMLLMLRGAVGQYVTAIFGVEDSHICDVSKADNTGMMTVDLIDQLWPENSTMTSRMTMALLSSFMQCGSDFTIIVHIWDPAWPDPLGSITVFPKLGVYIKS